MILITSLSIQSKLEIMKLNTIILVSMAIHFVACTKKFKFLNVSSCKSSNTVLEIEKCEVDDIYASVKFNLKTPIVKAMVS